MKKLLRYWWLLVVAMVVGVPVSVFSAIPVGPDWTTTWEWIPPASFSIGRDSYDYYGCDGGIRHGIHTDDLDLGFVRACSRNEYFSSDGCPQVRVIGSD